MVAFVKINDFVEDLAEKVHNLGSDQLVVALSNTAPASETSNPTADGNGQLSNVTQIDAGAHTNLSSRNITTSSSSQTSGTYTLVLNDLTLTASGAVSTFRYVYVYNDAATNDELIAHFDYGSALTLANGDSFTIDFGADGGSTGSLLTLA